MLLAEAMVSHRSRRGHQCSVVERTIGSWGREIIFGIPEHRAAKHPGMRWRGYPLEASSREFTDVRGHTLSGAMPIEANQTLSGETGQPEKSVLNDRHDVFTL